MIQHVIEEVFKTQKKGIYLDVGAGSGAATQSFYDRGWTGVCIEAETKSRNKGAKARPNDTWIKAAAVPWKHREDRVDYYHESSLRWASIDPDHQAIEEWSKHELVDFKGFRKTNVQAVHLNAVLTQENVKSLDLLIVDTNGAERGILDAFDFGMWKPSIAVIRKGDTSSFTFVQAMGYYLLYEDAQYWVFSNDNDHRALIQYIDLVEDDND